MREFDKHTFFILLFLSFGLCFFAINTSPLWEPLESVYKEITSNSFPPLYYGLLTFIQKIEMLPDITLRAPSAIAVALTSFSLYLFCTKIFDQQVGWWSCIILLTTAIGIFVAKITFALPVYVFFLTFVIFSYLRKQYWLMYFFMFLGVMTVGICGLIFPLAIIVIHCILINRIEKLENIHLILGTLLILGVTSPWFFIKYSQYGNIFLEEVFSCQHLVPLYIDVAKNHSCFYYFVPFLIAIFPWTGTFPSAFFASFGDSRNEDFENLSIMHIWWISGFLFLMIYPLKFFTMLWLIAPPLSVILGWNFYRLEKIVNEHNVFQQTRTYVWGSLITFLAMAFSWFILGKLNMELEFSGIVIVLVTLIIYAVAIICLFQFKDIHFYLMLHAGAGVMNLVFFYIFFFPVIVEQLNLKNYLSKIIG